MRIHGKLLTDPDLPPEPGTLEMAPDAAGLPRISAVRFGEAASGAGDLGGHGRLIVPAFTDAHFHAPQIDSVGCDGMGLLEWLDRVIFPAEAWWGRGYAEAGARTAAQRLLTQGTAGVAAYLSSHAGPSRDAVSLWRRRTPLRFHAGRSAMDREAPDDLTAEDREAARATPSPSPLLAPFDEPAPPDAAQARCNVSANPRFAVSCTEELLAQIGWSVRAMEERLGRGVFVQTHLAETTPEVERVRELFPGSPHYTGVYDAAGLLGPRTLLAHAVHLSPEEWALIAERDAVVVHCPGANVFLRAGLFDLDAAREHGVRVGLGSDVAAGPDVAMPRVARQMIEVAKVRSMTLGRGVHVPTPAEAWRMITETNAALLGWPDAGRLEPGCRAEALVLRVPESRMDEHLVGRLIYNWDASLIEARVVNGEACDPASI